MMVYSSITQSFKFSKGLLAVWDNSMPTTEEVQTLQLSIGQDIILLLEENKVNLLNRKRTKKQVLVLYARRGLSMIIYVTAQVAAWMSIVYLTARSQVMMMIIYYCYYCYYCHHLLLSL